MALYEENFIGVTAKHTQDHSCQALKLGVLIRRHLEGAKFEIDGVEVDPTHTIAELVAVPDLLQRVSALQSFNGWRTQGFVEVLVGSTIVIDDVSFTRNGDDGSG